ncbi:rho guanine nucleotide exchange factor 8-like [Canna indica]|uniref:Rho guanine nucleotide exchange factor 8-like n=1 Tax=Canna indica TaxID=4628 RepID=A0AAQ3QIY6_9LILI|nr:rho guanine nucleotide exchange factor 8-like [Canna indica]
MSENTGRRARSLDLEDVGGRELLVKKGSENPSNSSSLDGRQIAIALNQAPKSGPKSKPKKDVGGNRGPSDIELMKEKFAKLLLGEDMSGGGTGVSSALALSNAITNLAASVFGEQRRLEPMAAERKARWRKEIDWLLSVTDYIVEFVPSQQTSETGNNMEIMITQQRKDLRMNIPALKKLDAMLIGYLDNFKDQREFRYVSRDADESEKGNAKRTDDKWWLPTVRVPPNGLSEECRKWIFHQKELVNQVLKAAMAINANVLMEMDIPEDYIENLPKNGRSSLGESLYKNITDGDFDADAFLETIDLSTEHKILDLKNRIEASVVIWRRKMNNKEVKSSWGVSSVTSYSWEKREQFEDRAETILLILKHKFPGIPQSALDISKIQYNKDVGFAILESYSRILESLAFTVMSRIEDVIHADVLTRNPDDVVLNKIPSVKDSEPVTREESAKLDKIESNDSMTLSDFMDWQMDQDGYGKEEDSGSLSLDKPPNPEDVKLMKKSPNAVANKRFSYIEKLVSWEI